MEPPDQAGLLPPGGGGHAPSLTPVQFECCTAANGTVEARHVFSTIEALSFDLFAFFLLISFDINEMFEYYCFYRILLQSLNKNVCKNNLVGYFVFLNMLHTQS